MLAQQTLEQLRTLRLDGMLAALTDAATSTAAHALPFEQRLTLLVQREIDWRDGRRLARLLKAARLKVASACMEDIDWRAGELVVRGKGARLDRLPLPEDVGQAIASYLKLRCAGGASRRVFLQSKAPYEGFLWVGAVSGLVSRALRRAGIDGRHRGGHVLRHSLATSMLKRGVSLPEISQVLRHQLTQTTEIYAKVDLPTLRELSQPWPGGAP